MRKLCIYILLVVVILVFSGCYAKPNFYAPYFAPESVIKKTDNHTIAIATYFTMGEEEYQKRLSKRKEGAIRISQGDTLWEFWERQVAIPLDKKKEGIFTIAYIGSGTMLKRNYALSVNHLFDHADNTYDMQIWVLKEGLDRAVEADLVCHSDNEIFADDYAIIKLRENLGLPGLKISKFPIQKGEKVIFSGSLGGLAFFTRFGFATGLRYFFRRDSDGVLHLSHWESYSYVANLHSGPGDSGASIKNIDGEIVGLIYCGIDVYGHICFSNPLYILHNFLAKHNLSWLAD